MQMLKVDADFIAGAAGVLISLALAYIPKLSDWFKSQAGSVKRLILFGLMLVTVVVIGVLGCYGVVNTGVSCDQQGFLSYGQALLIALIANQGTYTALPDSRK